MDSHHMTQLPSRYRQWSYLILFFFTSIFGGLVSHNLVSIISPHHHSAGLIPRGADLENRDVIVQRGLEDLLSSLGSDLLGAVENGASKLLPNLTSILGTLGLNGSGLVDSLATPAQFLGAGLADGALSGLNLSLPANSTAPSGVNGIAQNLGSGLTSTLFSSDSIKSLLKINPSALGSSGTVGQAVLALAQGLGGGTASGLKLTTSTKVVASDEMGYNTSGINGVAGNFGMGLSSSLFSAVQLPSLSSLTSMGGGVLGSSSNSSFNIAAIGTGLGAGIGEGTAIGLGFQHDDTSAAPKQDAAGIAQGFAKGLVSSFLQNGTLAKVTSSFSSAESSGNSSFSGLSLSSINIAKVAEGLAVGLIAGAGSQISNLQVNGTDTTSFNDTVGGAATGFGQGLGSEGAKLVSQILAGSNTKASVEKRSLSTSSGVSTTEKSVSLARRATQTTISVTDLASVISNLNASTINPLLQTGVDALTCEGIGGLVGVFFGLLMSNSINLKTLASHSSRPSTNTTLNLPDQLFIINSDSNTFTLNPARGITDVTINGTGIYKFIGIAAAHMIFAVLAYFIAIPLLMLLHNTQKVSLLANKGNASSQRSTMWLTYFSYAILLVALLTLILGIALRAGAKHFTSAHEILGLIVSLQTVIAAITTTLLKRQNVELPSAKNLNLFHYGNIALMIFLSVLTLLFGFTDLSSVSLCITQSILPTSAWITIGWLLLSPLVLAVGSEGLVQWLVWMRKNQKQGVGVGMGVRGGGREYTEVKRGKEKEKESFFNV